MKANRTLITLLSDTLSDEVLQSIEATEIGFRVYLSTKKAIDVQGDLYGAFGYSMYDAIVTTLDKCTQEIYNNK